LYEKKKKMKNTRIWAGGGAGGERRRASRRAPPRLAPPAMEQKKGNGDRERGRQGRPPWSRCSDADGGRKKKVKGKSESGGRALGPHM